LRAEIVKSGCSLESRKFPTFYSIFPPNTRREFFNRIDPQLPVASVGFRAEKLAMKFPGKGNAKTPLPGGAFA
jgi:hypothetical protein